MYNRDLAALLLKGNNAYARFVNAKLNKQNPEAALTIKGVEDPAIEDDMTIGEKAAIYHDRMVKAMEGSRKFFVRKGGKLLEKYENDILCPRRGFDR